MTGTKNRGEAAILKAVPSRGRCGMGPAPLGGMGGLLQFFFFFYILRPRGCILDKFWPIRLCVLVLCKKKVFVALKDKNIIGF